MGNTICCIKQLYYYHNTESKTYSILLLFFTSPITLYYDLIETKSKNSKGCNVCIHLYDLCVFPLWIDFGYKGMTLFWFQTVLPSLKKGVYGNTCIC